jgi:hypothetical protein
MSQGGGDGGGKPEKEVPVHVKNLKTNQKVDFKMPEMATVAATWARAYTELGEQRAADDEFQCADGTSLMGCTRRMSVRRGSSRSAARRAAQ